MKLGEEGGIVSVHKARGRDIVISPYYFADNLDGLADAAAACGAAALNSALKNVKDNQGWPLSLVLARKEIGGFALSPTELSLIQKLSEEGVIKPPTITFGKKQESFIFTPRPGPTRLNAANREVYERAMALISAVRKGQLLPNEFRIRSPLRILEALRERGFLGASSEAYEQHRNLAVLRVARLMQVSPGWWQLHLNRMPENEAALNLAIDILRTGAVSNMEVNDEARIALAKDEEYIQTLISASDLKRNSKQIVDAQAKHEYEHLMLKLG